MEREGGISVERLTAFDGEFWVHKNFPPVAEDTIDEFVDCVKELAARLAAIEDILGDDYDLERLRELVEADREGRCVVLSCKFGDTVYSIRHERVPDDEYRMSFHTEMRIISQKFGLNHADCIGKTVFLTREEAEAALAKLNSET